MINVKVFRNSKDDIYGFTVKNHGSSLVCAAVSILVINTINCIEKFLEEPAQVTVDEKAGYIECFYPQIKEGVCKEGVSLLLNTMLFGLNDIYSQHNKDISIID